MHTRGRQDIRTVPFAAQGTTHAHAGQTLAD